MNKLLSICGVLAVASAATASGEDFPLTFRTIPLKDVMSFTRPALIRAALSTSVQVQYKCQS